MIKIEVKHTPDDKERAQSLSGHLMSFVYEGIVVQYIEVKAEQEPKDRKGFSCMGGYFGEER